MDPDYLSPPPAYSEQEFDQKIAQATDLSVIASSTADQLDGWERYDPAAFEAIPASTNVVNLPSPPPSKGNFFDNPGIPANNNSSTSALPTIVPLRIEKKSQFNHHDPYYNATVDRVGVKSPLPSVLQHSHNHDSHDNLNSYPHEHYVHQQGVTPPYSPVPISQSRSTFTPSASNFVPQRNWEDQGQRPLSDSYWPSSQPRSTQPRLPATPDKRLAIQEQRGANTSHLSSLPHPSAPLVPFDPTVAYRKPTSGPSETLNAPASPAARVQYDPHSLYNSAVSAQMHPLKLSHGMPHQAPSNEQSHNQGLNAPPRPVYPTHTFNDDPLSRGSHPLATNIPRQSVGWQSPSRPTSHYPTTNSPHNFAAAADINQYSRYSNG